MSESGSNVYPLFGARRRRPTSLVHCEGGFGRIAGKTANGLVRHSDRYQIVAIVDSTRAGLDAGMVLGDEHLGIPVHRNLDESIAAVGFVPDHFIVGSTSKSGMLTDQQRTAVLDAISRRMNIVNGSHDFLSSDREFLAAAAFSDVVIDDVGRRKRARDLRMFTGEIRDVPCARVAVLGTDDAIGKRTTATVLTGALRERGIRAVMVATGQTGLTQGARHGVALDTIPAQFCAGEVEGAVIDAYVAEEPDVIVVEGQGAFSHPASMCSAFVLRGACPSGVVLQHAPGRAMRSEHPSKPMPTQVRPRSSRRSRTRR